MPLIENRGSEYTLSTVRGPSLSCAENQIYAITVLLFTKVSLCRIDVPKQFRNHARKISALCSHGAQDIKTFVPATAQNHVDAAELQPDVFIELETPALVDVVPRLLRKLASGACRAPLNSCPKPTLTMVSQATSTPPRS